MKKNKIILLTIATVLLGGVALLKAQRYVNNPSSLDVLQQSKIKKILYFNPEISPNLEEIVAPSYMAFFSEVSDKMSENNKNSFLRADQILPFDSVDTEVIKEYCANNQADFAVVPKIKYFKVGLGKFVFSSQVMVSMKLYNAQGDLIGETQYDTYKKNRRLLGSAENFIKMGTKGALKEIMKNLKSHKNES